MFLLFGYRRDVVARDDRLRHDRPRSPIRNPVAEVERRVDSRSEWKTERGSLVQHSRDARGKPV